MYYEIYPTLSLFTLCVGNQPLLLLFDPNDHPPPSCFVTYNYLMEKVYFESKSTQD